MVNILKDTDVMPWGKYKGTLMQDVPADYLFWLWSNGSDKKTKICQVADYIERNLHILKVEHPDGIW